jgi:hypothetical protein
VFIEISYPSIRYWEWDFLWNVKRKVKRKVKRQVKRNVKRSVRRSDKRIDLSTSCLIGPALVAKKIDNPKAQIGRYKTVNFKYFSKGFVHCLNLWHIRWLKILWHKWCNVRRVPTRAIVKATLFSSPYHPYVFSSPIPCVCVWLPTCNARPPSSFSYFNMYIHDLRWIPRG